MVERFFIRILVGAALGMALLTFILVPVPQNAKDEPVLPAVAFEQVGLYRLEVALLVFYGGLLLVTPACSGLIRGRLPIEISMRGARFADESDQSGAQNEAKVKELEQLSDAHTERLATLDFEIERLREMNEGDSTQPGVDSKP